MKISRLLEITIILLNQGTVTARELAERFEVSSRTIYRDVDALSAAGVPVFTNKGSGGGISLLENFALNKAILSNRESESILIALKTLQATKYPEIEAVMDKLGALFKSTQAEDWVQVDFSPWDNNPNSQNKFDDIKRAILARKVIEFSYINSWNKKSSRVIEPMKLFYKGQAWYLWGYCREKQGFRVFKLTRIKKVSVTDENFDRRKPQQESGSGEAKEGRSKDGTLRDVRLRLKFQPEVLYRLYDDYDEEFIKSNPDGTFEVEVTFPEDEWVYGYILSYGCSVEVMEPQHIRVIISERMVKALKYYGK